MAGDPGKEGRPREDRDVAAEVMRDLAEISRHLGALKGESWSWLHDGRYSALRHRLEDAHAAAEAALVEARRRVRLDEAER